MKVATRIVFSAAMLSLGLSSPAPGADAKSAAIGSGEQPASKQRLHRRGPAPVPFRGGAERLVSVGRLTVPRAAHTATLLINGKVLVAGGLGGPESTEVFDPASMSFSPGPPLLEPRAGSHTATLLDDGRVLIAGGWLQSRPLSSSETYDPATDTFSLSGRMITNRAEHTATLLASGEVLLAGGVASSYDQPFLSSAEVYDPATGSFGSAGAMTIVRYKHAAALLPDGRVLVIGGSDARDDVGRYASSELFDPADAAFVPGADMSERRYKLPDAVAALAGGKILVAGGGEQVEIYDAAAGTFRTVEGSLGDGRLFMT